VKRGLIWYILTLVAYGISLYLLKEAEILSVLYHLTLFFVIREVAFRRPKFNINALALFIIPVISFAGQVFLYNKTPHFYFEYSILNMLILGPVSEEIFFRGYLQEKLAGKMRGEYSVLISATLFSLIHLPRLFVGLYTIPGVFVTFLLGCMFGWSYSESKSIAYPIALHSWYNLVALLFT